MPSIRSRLDKLEAKIDSTDNVPKWLFVTIINDDGNDLKSIQDINPLTKFPHLQNDDDLPTEEFLVVASDFYGIDMAEIYNQENKVLEVK